MTFRSSLEETLQMSTHELDIRPVAGRIGAEIGGVTLTADLPDAAIAAAGPTPGTPT